MRMEPEVDVKRARSRQADIVRKQSTKNGGANPLDCPPISKHMWKDIYEIFRQHFSIELPFVRETTLYAWAAQTPGDRSSQTEGFLLGMLALTARFVPELVQHHTGSTGQGRDFEASDFYALALRARLHGDDLCQPSMMRCQALLMLGMYLWGMCRGRQSSTYTGNALM